MRTAWLAWLAVLAVISVMVLSGYRRSVVPVYRTAALHWLGGQPLYTTDGIGFLYLPQAAILHIPFAILPPRIGEFLWRVVAIGIFASGVHRFTRLSSCRAGCHLFPLVSLIVIPLAWDSARNGQATLPLAGLMLLSVVDLAEQRWTRSALALSLGLAVKPLALVLILLMVVRDRPMRWPLAAGMAVVLALPFLAQRPAYVTQQYLDCLESFQTSSHVGVTQLWAQPFSALGLVGVHLSANWQTIIRATAALAVLFLCWTAWRQLDRSRYVVFLYGLTASYLVLFNPRTENNSYALLAPALGVLFAEAILLSRKHGVGVLLLVLAFGTVGSFQVGRWLVPHLKPIWLAPLMATFFVAYLLVQLVGELRCQTRYDIASLRGRLKCDSAA